MVDVERELVVHVEHGYVRVGTLDEFSTTASLSSAALRRRFFCLLIRVPSDELPSAASSS
jgi:hypothetical protein